MNLDDLKNQWQSEHQHKSRTEILQLISRKSAQATGRARRKALLESGAFVLVLLVFFTGLDPERNSMWVNGILVLVVAFGIGKNLLLYRSLILNPAALNLSESLQRQIDRLWWQIKLSVPFAVLFFGAVFSFLLLRVEVREPALLLLLAILSFSVMIRSWVEISSWKKTIQRLRACQMELSFS